MARINYLNVVDIIEDAISRVDNLYWVAVNNKNLTGLEQHIREDTRLYLSSEGIDTNCLSPSDLLDLVIETGRNKFLSDSGYYQHVDKDGAIVNE